MPVRFVEIPGLSVAVDEVVYSPQLNAPPDKPHPFAYFLAIHNESDETVTIFGRKWIVTDASGGTLVVEGEGVVGQTPRLEPGQTFKYNSYHVVGETSRASGTFFGRTDSGRTVCVRVPEFRMEPPG